MPTRYFWLVEWADPQVWVALIVALSGLVTALGTLAKVMHNTSRLGAVEGTVQQLTNGGAPVTRHDPDPGAQGEG